MNTWLCKNRYENCLHPCNHGQAANYVMSEIFSHYKNKPQHDNVKSGKDLSLVVDKGHEWTQEPAEPET